MCCVCVLAKLSSSGSDSEHEESGEQESQLYPVGMLQQPYAYSGEAAGGGAPEYSYSDACGMVQQYAEGEEDANSFDPQAFFDSFARNQTNTDGDNTEEGAAYSEQGQVATDINNDLQMSDSESEDEGGGMVEVEDGAGEIMDVGEQDDDGDDSNFNIEEFLQKDGPDTEIN